MSDYTSAAAREAAALAKTALGSWISVHTANPGNTGANEAAGVTRVQTTWTGGIADGSVPGSNVSLTVPPGAYTHFGIWSASTGGTYVDGGPIETVVVAATGPLVLTPRMTEF